jgi:hypothetical protein
MSHFTSIKTALISPTALISGLEKTFEEKGLAIAIDQFASPTALRNNYDANDHRSAHIVIRREHLSGDRSTSLVDMGYLLNEETGRYELQADPYDFRYNSALGKAFNGNLQEFNTRVQYHHDRAHVYEVLEAEYPTSQWVWGEGVTVDGVFTMELHKKPELMAAWS